MNLFNIVPNLAKSVIRKLIWLIVIVNMILYIALYNYFGSLEIILWVVVILLTIINRLK